jgi:predicted nucleotidyltransferase component of viral defense system
MTERQPTNLGASIRQRLLNRARATGRSHQELAVLFAIERLLFRLGSSPFASDFVLKGGLMNLVWVGDSARPTRDLDLLGLGDCTPDAAVTAIREIVAMDLDDGLSFDLSSIRIVPIATALPQAGIQLSFTCDLGGMRLPLHVDVGFGDAVVPPPVWISYPSMLDFEAPRLLGYPAEVTAAEKLHAIVVRGRANTRLKDYYDLYTASGMGLLPEEGLAEAIAHTFRRRATAIPEELPEGLEKAFALDRTRGAQWEAFKRKSSLPAPDLLCVTEQIAQFAGPAFARARQHT